MAEIQIELAVITGLDAAPDMSTPEGRYQVAKVVFDTPQGVEKLVADIEAKVAAFVPDLSTKKGRDAIASMAYRVSQSKTFLDGLGKDLVSELKAKTGKVDADRKIARDRLDSLRDKTRAPLDEWEEAEKARLAAEKLAKEIDEAHAAALAENDLFNRTRELAAKEAELARVEAERLAKEEAERKEREAKEAAEHAEQERKEREERIRREAEERAKKEAEEAAAAAVREAERKEQEAREAVARAEREKVEASKRAEEEKAAAVAAAEEKARKEAEAKEFARQVAESKAAAEAEAARREAERKAADVEHRRKVNREALECLMDASNLEEEQAKAILTAIIGGFVSHVSIKY